LPAYSSLKEKPNELDSLKVQNTFYSRNYGLIITIGGFNSFSARYPYLCTSKTLQKKSVEGALPSEIIPDFLFLGSYENATNKEVLNRLKISHVLTVAAELDLQNPPDLVWRHIRVNDTTGDDIAQHLSTAFQFIGAWY
jgi:dual specificity MAP kinase phosphatase